MTTPAEQRAADEGMPVVAMTPFEFVRVATGNPMVSSTLDGTAVLVRLYTVDEFMDAHLQAIAGLPADARPPIMTRAEAVKLVAPVGGTS